MNGRAFGEVPCFKSLLGLKPTPSLKILEKLSAPYIAPSNHLTPLCHALSLDISNQTDKWSLSPISMLQLPNLLFQALTKDPDRKHCFLGDALFHTLQPLSLKRKVICLSLSNTMLKENVLTRYIPWFKEFRLLQLKPTMSWTQWASYPHSLCIPLAQVKIHSEASWQEMPFWGKQVHAFSTILTYSSQEKTIIYNS